MKPETPMPEATPCEVADRSNAGQEDLFEGLRSTWKAAIARDERAARSSELRLARLVVSPSPRRSWTFSSQRLAMAVCAGLLVLGAVSRTRSAAREDGIRAEPIASAPVSEASAIESASVASAAAGVGPPASPVLVATNESSKPPKPPPTARPVPSLPPLPAPEPPAKAPRGGSVRLLKTKIDRSSFEIALAELASGEWVMAHDRLRLLMVHGDSALALDAAAAFTASLRDPRAELAIWDDVMKRPLAEPYRTQAKEARARARARLEGTSVPPAPGSAEVAPRPRSRRPEPPAVAPAAPVPPAPPTR